MGGKIFSAFILLWHYYNPRKEILSCRIFYKIAVFSRSFSFGKAIAGQAGAERYNNDEVTVHDKTRLLRQIHVFRSFPAV